MRLTRRGRLVAGSLVVALAAGAAMLVLLLTAPGGALASNGGESRAGYRGMTRVLVQPGQTLWSIAAAAEPRADPRLVIQQIASANALGGSAIYPGELLWVPKG
ncbi:MAG: LysM peptidoglycan-binding domain-containing protein [Streptosporangiaceae bacterium]